MPMMNPIPKNISRERGFTLIELIVTMVVIAIVAAIGVPNFQDFVKSNRAATQTNTVIIALSLARSEAIKQGQFVTVCASADQATCSTNWSAGWIVFQDDNTTGAPENPTGAELIRVWGPVEGDMTLTAADSGGTALNYIRFASSGLTTMGGSSTFLLDIPDCTDSQNRLITVSVTGNASVDYTATSCN